MKVLTYKTDAERVYGADACTGQHKLLTSQTLIIGIFCYFLSDGGMDFFFHLSRRSIGEGNNEQVFNIAGIFAVAYSSDNSFDKHCGFA